KRRGALSQDPCALAFADVKPSFELYAAKAGVVNVSVTIQRILVECANRRMPTVLRIGPYRIYFVSHDVFEPPHVHVDRDDDSAKFWLAPVALVSNMGFTTPSPTARRRARGTTAGGVE